MLFFLGSRIPEWCSYTSAFVYISWHLLLGNGRSRKRPVFLIATHNCYEYIFRNYGAYRNIQEPRLGHKIQSRRTNTTEQQTPTNSGFFARHALVFKRLSAYSEITLGKRNLSSPALRSSRLRSLARTYADRTKRLRFIEIPRRHLSRSASSYPRRTPRTLTHRWQRKQRNTRDHRT